MSIMKEIKVKCKIEDLEGIKIKIKKFAQFQDNMDGIDYFFEKENSEEKFELKLAKSKDKRIVTLKIPLVSEKIQENEKYTFNIDDEEDFIHFLEKIGFKLSLMLRKKEESYKFQNVTINLCQIEYIGDYLELIIDCEDEPKQEEKDYLISILEKIGLNKDELETRYYDDIRVEMGNEV